MPPSLQAIPTRYAGCHFRSRLEARWAVFFDTLGCRWEYEPQGFNLPNTGPYLPDFWVEGFPAKCFNTGKERLVKFWLEVKPNTPEIFSVEDFKMKELALVTGEYVYCGTYEHLRRIPKQCSDAILPRFSPGLMDRAAGYPTPNNGFSFDKAHWFDGIWSTGVGVETPCGSEILNTVDDSLYNAPFWCEFDARRWLKAAEAALSARFEHGQSGAT
jgi:hypothetical protein